MFSPENLGGRFLLFFYGLPGAFDYAAGIIRVILHPRAPTVFRCWKVNENENH
jgi:hypothetical protein